MRTQFSLNSQMAETNSIGSRLDTQETYLLIPTDYVTAPEEDFEGGKVVVVTSGQTIPLIAPDSAYTSIDLPGEGIWTAEGGLVPGRKYWLGRLNTITLRYEQVPGWPNYALPAGTAPGEFVGIIGARQGGSQYSTREFGIESSLSQQEPPDQAAQFLAALNSLPDDDVLLIDTVVYINSAVHLDGMVEQTLEFRGTGALRFGSNGQLFLHERASRGIRIIAGRKRIFHWNTTERLFPPVYGPTVSERARLDCEEVYLEWFGGGVDDSVDCGVLFTAMMQGIAEPPILSLRTGDFYHQTTPIELTRNDWTIVCKANARHGGTTLRNSTGGTVLKGPDTGLVSHIRLQGLRFQGIGTPIGNSQAEPVLDTSRIDSSTIVQCGIYNPKYGWWHSGEGGAIVWENCFFVRDLGVQYSNNDPLPYLIHVDRPPTMIGCQVEGDRIIVHGGPIKSADFNSCHLERCELIHVVAGRANFIGGVITGSTVHFGPDSFFGSIKTHNGTFSVDDLGFCNTIDCANRQSVPPATRTSDVVHQGIPAIEPGLGSFILESGQYYLLSIAYNRWTQGGGLKLWNALSIPAAVLGPDTGLSEDSPTLFFEGEPPTGEPDSTAPYSWRQQYAVIQAAENVHLRLQPQTLVRACIPRNSNPLLRIDSSSGTLAGYTLYGGNQSVGWAPASTGVRILVGLDSGSWSIGSSLLLDVSRTYALQAQVTLLDGPQPVVSIFGTVSNQIDPVLTLSGFMVGYNELQQPIYMYSRLFSPANHPSGDGRTGYSFGYAGSEPMHFEMNWLTIVEVSRRTDPAITSETPQFGAFRFPDEVRLLMPGSFRKAFCTSNTPNFAEGPGVVAGTMPESLSSTATVKRGEWWDYKGAVHVCRVSQAVTPIVLPDDPGGDQYWCSVLQPDGVSPVARAEFKSI